MIDSIFLAMSGLQGHQRGLNVISNNVANMNTPGFRGSNVSFADVFTGAAPGDQSAGRRAAGRGLDASVTLLDMQRGEAQSTGRGLDAVLQGSGFFVVRDESGAQRYTRDGAFDFDTDGELVMLGTTRKVLTRNSAGELVPLAIGDLRTNPSRPTTRASFNGTIGRGREGNDNDEDDVHSIELTAFDATGRSHNLRIELVRSELQPLQNPSVRFDVTVFEGELEIGSSEIQWVVSDWETSSLPITLALLGTDPVEIAFDFATVKVEGAATVDDLSLDEQDGRAQGAISDRSFDERGVLQLTYSNGEKAQGPQLVLASIIDEQGLVQLGDSLFAYEGSQPVILREANDDLRVVSGGLERSNVDLTQEFSELILMQRGYQASSQVVTTANEMLVDLLQMRGRR